MMAIFPAKMLRLKNFLCFQFSTFIEVYYYKYGPRQVRILVWGTFFSGMVRSKFLKHDEWF